VRRLYVENSVGRSVVYAFNRFTAGHGFEATLQHDLHPDMQQRQQEGDRWWIEDVAGRGFVILTCDLAIVESDDELAAVRETNAQVIAYRKADYTRWDKMRALARHWTSIERQLKASPLVLVITPGGTTPERLV
jgi:hypothetical protein